MVNISKLEIYVKSSRLGRAASGLVQWSDDYLMNLFRLLDGRVPVNYKVIRDGNALVFSLINGIDYTTKKNKLIGSAIFNPETGKYE